MVMYCPKCKEEYRDGYTVCAECGTRLERGCEPVVKSASVQDGKMEAMRPAKLISVENAVHAQMIAGVLEGNGIKCWIRDKESGDYMSVYMGYSVFGKDLYVDEADVKRAEELVDGIEAPVPSRETENGAEEEISVPPFCKNRRTAARILVAALAVAVAAGLILNIFQSFFG